MFHNQFETHSLNTQLGFDYDPPEMNDDAIIAYLDLMPKSDARISPILNHMEHIVPDLGISNFQSLDMMGDTDYQFQLPMVETCCICEEYFTPGHICSESNMY